MLNLEDLKAYENGQGQGHRFQFESKTFIFVNMFSGPQMHAFLYIVGSPNEAKKYSYTLKYFGSKSSITYVGQVAAIDESFGTVISTYKYLGISRMALRQFINVDGKIEYSLEVKSSMEEIKDETWKFWIANPRITNIKQISFGKYQVRNKNVYRVSQAIKVYLMICE